MRELPKANREWEEVTGLSGCSQEGRLLDKVVNTTHLHPGALTGYLRCSQGRLRTCPGAPREHHNGALPGLPLSPSSDAVARGNNLQAL